MARNQGKSSRGRLEVLWCFAKMGGAWFSIQKQFATDVGCLTRPRQPHDGICLLQRTSIPSG